MLSHFTREASRFPMFRLSRVCSAPFLAASVTAVLVASFCLPLCAQAQGHARDQALSAQSSSSASPEYQSRGVGRSLESRRLQTKLRREAQTVTETYTHRWEVYVGGQYMRFRPGPNLHNSGMGGWTLGLTRYFTPRFGITADARGYYGTNSLGATNAGGFPAAYNAKFSVFPFTIGPQYRFYGNSRWSISGAIQGGAVYGYFDQNTSGPPPQLVGFYPAGIAPGGIASLDLDYNISTSLAVRVAPNVLFDHFDGNLDHNQGFLVGVVYRFGRQ